MTVLIDTNVIVSGVLKDRGPEAVVLFVAAHPEFEWIVSDEILQEYQAVLRRDKFALSKEIIEQWHERFASLTTKVASDATINFPRDQKDAKFLACALAAQAEYFITGDRDFTEAKKLVDTIIISVSLFQKLIVDVWE